MAAQIKYYSKKEEVFNVITHGFGLMLSVAACVLLIVYASIRGNVYHIVSFSIFGASLIILYLASTLYHAAKGKVFRRRLNIFDHAAIYALIAGTYTPFALVTLQGPWGWSVFGVIWGLALVGIVLKLFYAGQYDKLSTIGYVLMGWVVLVATKPLVAHLSSWGLFWLFAGGFFYTIGAIFYRKENIPYNHGVFHLFVLGGSISHFFAIFFHVL